MTEADRIKWNGIYARGGPSDSPSSFLVSVADRLPRVGRAVDLAGGAGRNAVFLAARGLYVTVADVSSEGLAIAAERAEARGVAERVTTLEIDLDQGPPPGPWDVVIDSHYLQRSLFAALPDLLAPRGWFVFVQPTLRNLERHARPSARFLLDEGELPTLLPDGLDVVRIEESWGAEDRHEARLLARRA